MTMETLVVVKMSGRQMVVKWKVMMKTILCLMKFDKKRRKSKMM